MSIRSFLNLETPYEVLTFTSPFKALDHFAQNEVDLVISDYLMPEMDGISFLGKLRELKPDVPRIILTGYADKENAIKAINEVGLYQYIEKPWNNEDLQIILPLPVSRPGDPLFSAGMAIDGKNRLHLVWSTEQGLSAYALMDLDRIRTRAELKEDQIWLHPELGTAGALVLEPSASRVGDITLAPDGSVWVAWSVDRGEHRTGISVGRMGRRWRWGRVTEGYGVAPPSLQVDRSGRFYLAWHDIYEDTWYLAGGIANLKTSSLGAARKLVARAYRPVMLPTGDRLLAIFESDHSLLEYTFVEEEPAERHPLSQLDSRLHWDTLHSPQIATDRYGVPWLFFINSARHHVFYSRWLGTTWGPIHNGPRLIRNSPRMEDNHLSVDLLSVQEETGADSTGIALTLAHETRFPVTAFHAHPSAGPGG